MVLKQNHIFSKIILKSLYNTGTAHCSTQIQFIDFSYVQSYAEAKLRTWTIIGQLKEGLYGGTTQYYNNKLYSVGYTMARSSVQAGSVQIFNLDTNMTTLYRDVYSTSGAPSGENYNGNWGPGSYINDGTFTMFGGQFCSNSCVQQSGVMSRISDSWSSSCVSQDDTKLTGLKFQPSNGDIPRRYISYANILD